MSRSGTNDRALRRRLQVASLLLVAALCWGAALMTAQAQEGPTVRMVYFYADECGHCGTITEDVLKPLQADYGEAMEIKMVEISDPENYELLIEAEEAFGVSRGERGLPTLIIDGEVLIGEDDIRNRIECLLDSCIEAGGTSWPDIPGLEEVAGEPHVDLGSGSGLGAEVEPCAAEEEAACEGPAPIWMAYFYQIGCQECSRAEYDLRYAESKYPQLVVREFDVQEDATLAEWLGERLNVPEENRLATPALFVGEDSLIGEEITVAAVFDLAEKYAPTGAEQPWADFSAGEAKQGIVDRFKSFGALTVVMAGLVDGLNPCAFATLAFFVSYLTLSGRKGGEVLAVGATFTLGVFLAYLAVGLGFYRVLGMLGDVLTSLGRWIYGLTAAVCAALAVFSFYDYLKARRGDLDGMSLNLPHGLRRRINAVIRRGRGARAYVLGAFATGLIVSFLELACTGQVYLPTIVFVTSVPELRVRAILYLTLYNLLFVLPLIVVFVLTYYGTTSEDLTGFLQRNAPLVKFGMALLFASLAVWLGLTLV